MKKGANPTSCDQRGWNVLHYAASYGSYELIGWLANEIKKAGENINARDINRKTALTIAEEEHSGDVPITTLERAGVIH